MLKPSKLLIPLVFMIVACLSIGTATGQVDASVSAADSGASVSPGLPVATPAPGPATQPMPGPVSADNGQAAGPGSATPAGPTAKEPGTPGNPDAPVGVPPVTIAEPTDLVQAYRDLKARYNALKGTEGTERKFGIAAFLAIILKYLLDFIKLAHRVHSKPWFSKAMPWIAMGLSVPIALLSRYALGSGWFDALLYAGAGPGAIIVNELLKSFKSDNKPADPPTPVPA